MRLLLVIAPTYAESQRLLADYRRRHRWWHRNIEAMWFCEAHLARLWLIRCRRRGVAIDPVWVGADTAERRAAA